MLIQALICATLFSTASVLGAQQAQSTDRTVRIELVLNRAPSEVYKLWTTEAGVTKWFAPAARVDPRVGGRYEIIFDPETDPDGSLRGTKGAKILELVPDKKLVFEWIAFEGQKRVGYGGPPVMPEPGRSSEKTRVEVVLEPIPGDVNKTRIVLVHNGFRQGATWDAALVYFRERGWPGALQHLTDYCNRGVLPPWSKQR